MDRLQLLQRQVPRVFTRRRKSKSPAATRGARAPHPIEKGKENAACPITGLFADDVHPATSLGRPLGASAAAALAKLEADPDIVQERLALEERKSEVASEGPKGSAALVPAAQVQAPVRFVPLNVIDGAHKANSETRRLVQSVGGVPTLRRFTATFYKRCFADPHINQFIRRHEDAHGERFALWIAEKFGDGTPWTEERKTRARDVMKIGNQTMEVAFDRSSAHFAAWHSPKRAPHQWGQHFKPDDARVWMRLHFWAAREAGLFEPEYAAFMDYYMRFIGHFISIYSSKSPPFTRESARWSADSQNMERYVAAGNRMTDVIGVNLQNAMMALPPHERVYTGSRHANPAWPYGPDAQG